MANALLTSFWLTDESDRQAVLLGLSTVSEYVGIEST